MEYTPGRISAKAYRNGKCVAKTEQRTAGKPYAIEICPKNVTNYILDGFTMSEVTAEKPDPLVAITANDMNSFTPVQFIKDVFQKDFRDGWRIYRTRPRIAKDGTYKLDFIRARFRYMEIYVDGKQIDLVDTYTRGGYVTKSFAVKADTTPDIRILMYVENESPIGAGICTRVEMKETR